ncbi:MAG: DUF4115 domain-containing protein [Alphaproteobacteria bacterium]|jgi:cytoskeletal protein RodZ|nr:DUF4115 domain-containing protein [Alphaproteobacteria bacterium]
MIDDASVNHGEEHFWTVSSVLKRARESLGLSLFDVADVLRIRLVQLRAIEEGRFDELPGTVYAIGFVRSYADFLGLDSDRVVEMFRDEIAVEKDPPELIFPSPLPDSGVPGGALLMLAIVLAVVAYAGWYYVASPNRDLADLMPALPDRFIAMIDSDSAEEGAGPTADSGRATGDGDRTDREPGDLAGTIGSVPEPAHESAGLAAPTAGEGPAMPRGPAERDVGETERVPGPADAVASGGRPGRGANDIDLPGSLSESDPGPTRPDRVTPERFEEPRRSHDATTAEAATPSEPARAPVYGDRPDPARSGPDGGLQRPDDGRVRATVASFSAFDDLPLPPAAADGEPASGAQATADRGTEPRIVIRAVADSWVQVNDSDGSLVMTRTLRPGDRYEVPESEGLRLVTGNAGGLEILVDGRQVPALGASGAVLRDVPLDAQRLQNGTATPN